MYFNKETYHQLLDTFLPSEEMRVYLKTQPKESEHTILELIMGAPVPLSTKIRWSWGKDRRRAAEALAELRLRPGELLTLTEAWYDDDIREAKYGFNAPYLSFDNAIAYIRADLAECNGDGAEWLWYVLEKWVPGEKQELKRTYTYWLIGDQVMYFDKEDDRSSICRIDPNLPVPFQAGDLLTIDCRPFAPVKHALLLERGDNIDCCCLQGLCREEKTGLWITGAVKHWSLFRHGVDTLYTPIYRLSRFTGELPPEEKVLLEVQRAMGGDEQRGSELHDHVVYKKSKHGNHVYGMTDKELRRLAKKIENAEHQKD